MSAPNLVDGPLRTERLTVHNIHSRPALPSAPRVLLLGGSNFDLRLKRAFLDTSLAEACEIVTYEPRGIGRTDRPAGDWTMRDYALDAIAVLDAMGWQDACVIGESFGGMSALHLASLAPERVKALVIASATAGGPVHRSFDISTFLPLSRAEAANRALCLQDRRNDVLRKTNPAAFAALLEDRIAFETAFGSSSIAHGGYARLLAARKLHNCVCVLDAITAPTTVLAGRFDDQAPLHSQRALAHDLPNAEIHEFDAGHGVLFGKAEATHTALRAIETAQDKTR